jgi:predicted nicotinamide N-methyase
MTAPADTQTPRARCQHAIRHVFGAAIARYYTKHPDLLNDKPQLEAASYAMLTLMEEVLAVLDEFAIGDPKPKP